MSSSIPVSIQYHGPFQPEDGSKDAAAAFLTARFNDIAGILAMNKATLVPESLLTRERSIIANVPWENVPRLEGFLQGSNFYVRRPMPAHRYMN